MKYYSCDLIEHGLDFGQDSINLCCRRTDENGQFLRVVDDYHGELLDLEKFFALKREYRNKMKTGEGISICKNCIYLEEKDYDDEDYITTINFNHGLYCNSKCVYCSLTHGIKTVFPEYDVYPVIKQLSDNGYLRQGGFISIAGGEPSITQNFDKLIQLFIEKQIRPVRVLTNGIKYSQAIAEGLRQDVVNIMISVDAGSAEMYKWIKGVDVYDRVWVNIGDYLLAQHHKGLVKTKYIIIPEINDSKEEITGYFDQTEKYGVGWVAFDIELNWFEENKNNLPDYLYDLVEFTLTEADKRNLAYEPIDRVVTLIRELKKKKDISAFFRGHSI
ncbi:MAG: radical SAM protein [Candidatus Gastranaerophilales bacterium]|nr:radical SAM protein [Candidatus Gastranaerophilales bacterium]